MYKTTFEGAGLGITKTQMDGMGFFFDGWPGILKKVWADFWPDGWINVRDWVVRGIKSGIAGGWG